jgi:hypothetical protein
MDRDGGSSSLMLQNFCVDILILAGYDRQGHHTHHRSGKTSTVTLLEQETILSGKEEVDKMAKPSNRGYYPMSPIGRGGVYIINACRTKSSPTSPTTAQRWMDYADESWAGTGIRRLPGQR